MTNSKILIAEDDNIQALSLQSQLNVLGYGNVFLSNNVEEARARAEESSPDIALLDINLGEGEEGIALAREILALGVPVVFLSANTDPAILERAREALPYGYLIKPVSSFELKNTLEMALYRSAMERKLRESEEKYRVLFESIPMGISVTDHSGTILENNAMAEQLLGIERAEIEGRHIGGPEWEIVRTDGSPMPPEEFASMKAIREGRLVENVEMGLVGPEGETRWINVTATPISMDNYGVVIAYSDITARRKLENTYEFFSRKEWALAGEDYFNALARHLSANLSLDHVRIDRMMSDGKSALPMAAFSDGRIELMGSYALEGSAIPDVLRKGLLVVQKGAAEAYPDDAFLRNMEAECFAGAALADSRGRTIGFIAAAGRRPFTELEALESVLRVTATRAAGEMERRKLEIFQTGNANILEMVALGIDLETVFFLVTRTIREWDNDMLCLIMLLSADGRTLDPVSAPDLPSPFIDSHRGLEIGPMAGHWGEALFQRKKVITEDIASDPLWPVSGEGALAPGLRACWSFPIVSSAREVLGVLSVYRHVPGAPGDDQLQIMESASHIAGIAIESKKDRQQLLMLSQAIEHSPSVVVIADREGTIEYVNERFTELTGYGPEEAKGKNPRILNAGILPRKHYTGLWDTILSGKIWRGEFCNRKKNGEIFWEQASISPIKGSEGEIVNFVAVKEDITEKRMALENIRAAKDAAEQANRAKSAFLANMSHELRTPLNAVIGFSELMIGSDTKAEQRREYLGYIHQSGQHLLEMVNDVLDLSKIEEGRLELEKKPFSLTAMLGRILTSARALAKEKNIALKMDADPSIGYLNADEVRIKQVMLNLLSNAVKFTQSGGRIGIEARPEGDRARITVWDEGIGIAPEHLERIFKPFEQVDSAKSGSVAGTGLGLPIVKRLVEMHDGEIIVESAPEKGSRFTVLLPGRLEMDPGTDEAPISPEEKNFARSVKGARILVVDDNEINRELLGRMLAVCGCESVKASSGEEAVEIASRERFDLVFMDILMPGIDGVEAAKRIRSIVQSPLPIVALTAYAMKGDREKYVNLGMDDYISKPVKMERIYEILEKYAGLNFCEDTEAGAGEAGVDIDGAAESLGISPGDYLELAEKFIARSSEYMDALEEAAAREDLVKLAAEAHKLKGAALNMRFEKLADLVKKVEDDARAGTIPSGGAVFVIGEALNEIAAAVRGRK